MSAENLANEAEKKPQTITVGAGENPVTLTVPTKWKRFKLLRCINSGDVFGALEAAFGADQVELLDDLDVDEDEFTSVVEKLAEALSGTSQGN